MEYYYNLHVELFTILNWKSLYDQQNHCHNLSENFEIVLCCKASHLLCQDAQDAFFSSHISSVM